MKLRVNAPVEQATEVLERYAQLGAEIDLNEVSRQDAIAAVNVAHDMVALPIVTERDELRAVLEPWWKRMGAALLKGKRKTVEIAGCIIGSKKASAKLAFAHGDDEAAIAALKPHRWAKPYIRVTTSVDKTAIKAALDGKHSDQLKALGFSLDGGVDTFVLDRAK